MIKPFKLFVLNVIEIGFYQSQLRFTRPGGVATDKKLRFSRPGGVATDKKLRFSRPGGVATDKKGVATGERNKLHFARDDYIGAARSCIGSVCAPNLHAQICLRIWGDMHRVCVN